MYVGICMQARIQGGQGGLAPPPHTHTQKKLLPQIVRRGSRGAWGAKILDPPLVCKAYVCMYVCRPMYVAYVGPMYVCRPLHVCMCTWVVYECLCLCMSTRFASCQICVFKLLREKKHLSRV